MKLTLDPRRDLHNHTPYCNHAEGSMEEYIRSAISRGMTEIGFLEHVESGIIYPSRTWLDDALLETYWEEGQRLQVQYTGQIHVSLGVEVGINPACPEALLALVARHPWDRVGLSYHLFWDVEAGRHLNICSHREPENVRLLGLKDPLASTRHYYRTILEYIPVFRPQLLCHLDVIQRSFPDLSNHSEVFPVILEILDTMARTGVALELNTSGYDHSGRLYPSPPIVAAAVRRELELVLCSDSHNPASVGRYFDRALAEVAHCIQGISIS